MDKSPDAFRTIREVAESMDLPQHVLRFWETRFPQIKPLKRGGGRRYYRPDDVELLRAIKQLLYGEGYTIKGVQKLIKEQGARSVASGAPDLLSAARSRDDAPPHGSLEGAHHAPASSDDGPTPVAPRTAERASGGRLTVLSVDDFAALRGALEHIAEGERILSLARGGSPA